MDIITDDITTVLNFLNIFIDVSVGNIINELINNDPTNLIPNTTIIEHNVENIMLYRFTLIPIDFANVSSNVIANILLYEIIYNIITNNDNMTEKIISLLSSDKMLPNK